MRLTIDLDEPSLLRIRIAWHRTGKVCEEVRGRLSSSWEGVHIEGWGPDISPPIAERQRRLIGDDTTRIGYDLEKWWRPSQLLYDMKFKEEPDAYGGGYYVEAGPWVDDIESLIDMYAQHNEVIA